MDYVNDYITTHLFPYPDAFLLNFPLFFFFLKKEYIKVKSIIHILSIRSLSDPKGQVFIFHIS